jgi:hypothetical protein
MGVRRAKKGKWVRATFCRRRFEDLGSFKRLEYRIGFVVCGHWLQVDCIG